MTSAPDPAPPAATESRARRVGRALVRGFFPSVAAVHAAGLVWATQGIPDRGAALAALAFALVWSGVFLAMRRARRTPSARLVMRTVLAVYVAFMSARGLSHARLRPASPVVVRAVTSWPGEPQSFLAGIGDAAFVLDERDTLAGYGARPRRVAFPWAAPGPLARLSLDWMASPEPDRDPRVPMMRAGVAGSERLGARALLVRPRGEGAPLAIVRLDLVMCDARLRQDVLAQVADLGIVDDTLVLTATHTHSGPGGFTGTCLAQLIATDHLRKATYDRVVAAVVEAVRAAERDAVPARIGFVRARDAGPDRVPVLASNRSNADRNRLDTEVLGIRFDAADGPRRIALLLNYAVHPVWGRPKDSTFSQDVAGALERSAPIADGATTLFVNGAEGDVKPRVKRPDASNGETLAPFEAAVSGPLAAPATDALLRVKAATAVRDFGSPRFVQGLAGSRPTLFRAAEGPFAGGFAEVAAAALLLPVNALVWSAGCEDLRVVGSLSGSIGACASLDPYLGHTSFPVEAILLETASGKALLVGAPGEPTTAVGERIKAEGRRRGASPVYVLGLANDHLAYVGTDAECAAATYEGRMTLFGPRTADLLLESVEAAMDAVGLTGP